MIFVDVFDSSVSVLLLWQPLLEANAAKAKQYPVWNWIKKLAIKEKLTPSKRFLRMKP
jgi:hypothetical protein